MAVLNDDDIRERLEGTEWEREGDAIEREWVLEDFAAALAFVQRVGEAAEDANHHPDVFIHGYNKVRVTLSTHSEGGLTDADFELAATIDAL